MGHALPASDEVPPVESEIVEVPSDTGPFVPWF